MILLPANIDPFCINSNIDGDPNTHDSVTTVSQSGTSTPPPTLTPAYASTSVDVVNGKTLTTPIAVSIDTAADHVQTGPPTGWIRWKVIMWAIGQLPVIIVVMDTVYGYFTMVSHFRPDCPRMWRMAQTTG